MRSVRQAEGQCQHATVLAVYTGTKSRVLASGKSIDETMNRAKTATTSKREPIILFVPRKDAIHVF